MTLSRDMQRLLEIMVVLRDPVRGCSWDRAQSFRTIAPYTIEEAYEVVDAIERGDFTDLRDELGDLLLQVVYHAQLAQEQEHFGFGEVVKAITAKLVRRHPHVFGDATHLPTEAVAQQWQDIKAQERRERASASGDAGERGVLDGVLNSLPGLTRALRLSAAAANVGFDWDDVALVLQKVREELAEVEAEVKTGDADAVAGEIGDLLFAVANLARHLGVDPEGALRRTNEKFIRRFGFIEAALRHDGKTPQQSSLPEMDRLWEKAKAAEKLAVKPEPLP